MAYAAEGGLGAALRSLRMARGLGLGEAARRGGVSKAALGAWEVGTRCPRGPALSRLLDALNAGDRTKARILNLADPRYARIVLADSPFGSLVDVGMVLRVMRERRGMGQALLAQRLGVSQATVSRWEAGDDAPSPETVHAIGFALGAAVEEALALASATGRGGGGLTEDLKNVQDQMGPYAVPYPLREAVFLGWEAELGRRAARDARWDELLVLALARRANWLAEEERYSEIAPLTRRAMSLAATPVARLHAVPTLAALADADRRLGRGHEAAAELAGEWAARLPDSQLRAWMIRQRGMNLVRMGRTAEGVDLVERSAEMDVAAAGGGLHPWAYPAATLCEAYLEAGDPKRAAALLGGRLEQSFDPATFVRVGHAVGRAATTAQMAYLRRWVEGQPPAPVYHRRQAEIESRQAWLSGEKMGAGQTSDEGKTEDELWSAVLREQRG